MAFIESVTEMVHLPLFTVRYQSEIWVPRDTKTDSS